MARKSKEEMIDELQEDEIDNSSDEVELEDESSEEEEAEEELEEDSGVPSDYSKTNLLSVAMKKLSGMKSDDLVAFFNASIASIGKESDAIPDGTAEKNKASVAAKGAIKEDLETIFGADKNLSEEFKNKLTTLFESAVGLRVSLIEAELQEQYEKALQEEVAAVSESLVEHLDTYLDEICKTWIEENKVAVESTLVNELNTSFIEGLKDLFHEHYHTVPEEKADALDVLAKRVEELEESLNTVHAEKIEVEKILRDREREDLVAEAAEGLSVTQVEKFKKMCIRDSF